MEYVMNLVKDCGEDFPYDINVSDILHEHVNRRDDDISTYRDYSYTSKYTGTKATKPSISFMKNKDDSFESFRNQSNEETKFQNTVSVVTGILENHIAHSCSIRQNFFPAASWSPMSNDRFSTFF